MTGAALTGIRLMPNLEPTIGHCTVVPNRFWRGVLLPAVVFGVMFLWPE